MPTPSPFKALLTQFQSRYPMGCVSSDLLTIHQGQYVVRSVAQLGNTVLATGMASASEIEAAEDRSKIRALEALGLGIAATGSSPISALNHTLFTPSFPDPEQPVGDAPPTAASLKSPPEPSYSSESEIDHPLPTNPSPVSSSGSSKTSAKPSTPTISSKTAVPLAESSSPVAKTIAGSEPTPSVEVEPISAASRMNELLSTSFSNPSTAPTPSTTLTTDEIEHFAFTTDISTSESESFSTFDSSHSVDSTLPSGTAAISVPTAKPEKAATGRSSKRKSEAFEVPPTPTPSRQPADRSEEIMKIGIEMKRLGWSTEQGREYLKRTYGKRSRQELDDAELLDFLRYLETQPAPVQTPF